MLPQQKTQPDVFRSPRPWVGVTPQEENVKVPQGSLLVFISESHPSVLPCYIFAISPEGEILRIPGVKKSDLGKQLANE